MENLRLIEVSWEVCNKVGGIHTVLTTKLPHALKTATGGYLAIGPYYENMARTAFKESDMPEDIRHIAHTLGEQGVILHYGHWLVDGNPQAILLEWKGLAEKYDAIKHEYWENHALDTMKAEYYDVGEPLLWSRAVGMFTELYAATTQDHIMLHVHEWLSGGALLYLKGKDLPNLRTVFTTHATILGRCLMSRGDFIYDKLESYDPAKEAENTNIVAKFQLEKLSAQYATIFTTVSDITASEATAFLGRKPEVITENGVDLTLFPDVDELIHRRRVVREHIHSVITALFFPQKSFSLLDVSYQFTMGRYEFHNKGYDLYLESLADLNAKLKSEHSTKTVISLFLVPGECGDLDPEAERKLTTHRLAASRIEEVMGGNALEPLTGYWGQSVTCVPLTPDLQTEISMLMSQLSVEEHIPVSPYTVPETDPITVKAREVGLHNAADDRVKVLFLPLYITGLDSVFGRELYDLVAACDVGIFSSTYEPWGYTPMESMVLGVPAITSSLAGFGRAMINRFPNMTHGVSILNRDGNNPVEERAALTSLLVDATNQSGSRQAIQERLGSLTAIAQFDWDLLYDRYRTAYQLAFA